LSVSLCPYERRGAWHFPVNYTAVPSTGRSNSAPPVRTEPVMVDLAGPFTSAPSAECRAPLQAMSGLQPAIRSYQEEMVLPRQT
jgi:hypothetical protein